LVGLINLISFFYDNKKVMKKLALVLALAVSGFVNGQNDYRQYPFESDNQLVQIVPTIENREVSMEFVDTLFYLNVPSMDNYSSGIVNERYKSVLSQYEKCEFYVTYLGVNPFNKKFNHYGVCLFFWSAERGRFHSTNLDLYNVEMSFQKGTLKKDLIEVFEQTIIQYDEFEEYLRLNPLEPLEGVKMFDETEIQIPEKEKEKIKKKKSWQFWKKN
jgi:hypothetical protein